MMRSLIPFLIVMACGNETPNPNASFVTNHDKLRTDVLLKRAEVEFDRNRLDLAQHYASVAYNRNTNNQYAALQLANIYLGQAQLAILSIAGKVATDLNVSQGTVSNTQALDVLGTLIDEVGVTPADYLILGSLRDNTNPNVPLFNGLNIIEPFEPGVHTNPSSPRYKLQALQYLGKAIALLCPFIPANITLGSTDSRDLCKKVPYTNANNQAQVYFVFAMAHLYEALFFTAVLEYSNQLSSQDTATKTIENANLFKRVKAVQSKNFASLSASEYLSAVSELVHNIQAIFDSGNSGSMLTLTLIDIKVTEQALLAINGFPASMLVKIQSVQQTIDSAIDQLGKASTIANQAAALKDQFSGPAIQKLNGAINAYINSIPANQKPANQATINQICAQYKSITGVLDPATAPPIAACP